MKNINWKSVILVLFIIFLVIIYFRYFNTSSKTAETSDETVQSEQNNVNESSESRVATIGSKAPLFSLSDSFDKNYNLEKLIGEKPILLVFETTWCSWCKKELADLEKFRNTYKDKILLLTIDIGETKQEVKSWVETNDIKRPWLLDNNEAVTTMYLASGTPNHILIDKNGIVIDRWPGYATWEKLEELANKALEK